MLYFFSPLQFSLFVTRGPTYAPPQQKRLTTKRGGSAGDAAQRYGGGRAQDVKETPDAKAKWTRPES
jgi:hypothetical protein